MAIDFNSYILGSLIGGIATALAIWSEMKPIQKPQPQFKLTQKEIDETYSYMDGRERQAFREALKYERANVYGKVMCIIDDIRGVVRGDKRQVLEDLKDKLREKFEVKND